MPRHQLAKVIAERTMKVQSTEHLSQAVAAYLLEIGQTADLEPLMRDIMQYRADHGTLEVTAVSAHDLSSQVVADIKKLLKQTHPHAKTITIDRQIAPSVIGGVRLDLANEQWDLTTQAKLNTFKRLTGAGKEY